jgi:hypothetical protein
MFVKTKSIMFLLCCIAICSLMGGEARAASNDAKAPLMKLENAKLQWTNTTSVDVNLAFDGSKGNCGACVIGRSDTTEITGTVILAQKNSNGTYSNVKKWTDLKATGNKLIFDKTYYVSKGYTYRLTITATVYRNGSGETVTGSFEAYAE